MTKSSAKNISASVKQRLLNIARERKEEFQHLLTRYGNERLLARLAASEHARDFVVKGATLFTLWAGEPHRATRDLDLLGFGPASLERIAKVFRDLCSVAGEDDGLLFEPASVQASRIREEQEYEGVRVEMLALLGGARISLQIDVGFGDVITPAPVEAVFPTLLAMPASRLRAYPRVTVVAEKLHAMVSLGMANSRMKDFFDVWLLAKDFDFDGNELVEAVSATFERRATNIPIEGPLALTTTFSGDPGKLVQWKAFVTRSRPTATPPALPEVVALIEAFLGPVLEACRTGRQREQHWPAGGPWQG